ncbi:MAG: pyridine nucleotide-disulfide oxidoreductase [Gammaproteobacteria bacterium]|nr:pyridine nucleotide-disulfide oxidoreductase [Gammaproteobacteria bacterium]
MTDNFSKAIRFVFGVLTIILIWWGVERRDLNLISAESGLGYALGIVGAILMLLLLVYPLRKRVRVISRFGSIKFWFRTHMLFGVLGPVLILFHSNFQIGSLNSTVAMLCMLTVAISGLVGRYLYGKIHHGLYGSHIEMKELKTVTQEVERGLSNELGEDEFLQKLYVYENSFTQSKSLLMTIMMFISAQIKTRILYKRELADLDKRLLENVNSRIWNQQEYGVHKKLIHGLLADFFRSIRKTAGYIVSEKLFSLWHLLHLPIFFLMLISALVHVFVVHMY